MNLQKITIREYLTQKGIPFHDNGKELITKCLFNNCDKDSSGSEAHLYFSTETGQYNCKKCGVKGNLITLAKFLNDDPIKIGPVNIETRKRNVRTITPLLVEKYHNSLTPEIREYLNNRGISDKIISEYKIGYGNFHKTWWITIPIKDLTGNFVYLKLRQDPKYGDKKITWPEGEAQIYEWDDVINATDRLLITEGETDALLMKANGINCISSTHGANTFKEEWLKYFNKDISYYICYDNDAAGRSGTQKVISLLYKNGFKNINVITLPDIVGDKGDLGDYVSRLRLPISDLFSKYSKPYPEKIDASIFQPITSKDIVEVLEPTIKKDDVAKVITTLAMINTYTEESQMNIFFNAPSSTGKSHIPLSISELFPKEDLIILANCSPAAFFHEQGKYVKEVNEIRVDLSKKILIFTDMPHPELLTRLRSFLSHDQKESKSKITDKSEKGGNRTKVVVLIGFPTVMFCSAGLKVDEQESTRFIMLSPSIEQDKLIAGIKQSIQKEANKQSFRASIEADEKRSLFKKRILAIKQANIADVIIGNSDLVEKLFLHDTSKPIKPRQQRDIKKVICLIKGFSLFNLWFRKRDGDYIYATEEDITEAYKLWDSISIGQDYGLAPYIFKLYTDIIIPLWKEKINSKDLDNNFPSSGIKRQEILKKHNETYGRPLSMIYLRQHILPQLEQAGLIAQEKSNDDGRQMVVFPLELEIDKDIQNNSAYDSVVKQERKYSDSWGGVKVQNVNLTDKKYE
ncbi:toprim domain-containing protein [Patescibacteria group bacterium]|nr:toprim domain-containing protein [Patescibacteria group bacterium]MDE1946901.1 toprim domain-containing protein [Patescibacteria group bacterium]MDE2011102.1 toprim domain-containing protein [Patescibacteria group bacterium]